MTTDTWAAKVRMLYPNGTAIFTAAWRQVRTYADDHDRLRQALAGCGFYVDLLHRDGRHAYRLASGQLRCQSEYFICAEAALYDAVEMALRVMEQRVRRREAKEEVRMVRKRDNRVREREGVERSWWAEVQGK